MLTHVQGLLQLFEEHVAWWSEYWPASFISIPDTVAEGMVILQHYKYASAARAGGPAIDLMGKLVSAWFAPGFLLRIGKEWCLLHPACYNTGPWWQNSGWELYWWDMNVPVCNEMLSRVGHTLLIINVLGSFMLCVWLRVPLSVYYNCLLYIAGHLLGHLRCTSIRHCRWHASFGIRLDVFILWVTGVNEMIMLQFTLTNISFMSNSKAARVFIL